MNNNLMNSSYIMHLVGIGLALLSIAHMLLNGNIDIYNSSIFSFGFSLIVVHHYGMSSISDALPFILGSFLGGLGMIFLLFSKNLPVFGLETNGALFLYPSIAIFFLISHMRADSISSYTSSLDARVLLSSFLFFASGYSYITGVQAQSFSLSWAEGFIISFVSLLYLLSQKEHNYMETSGYKISYLILLLSGLLLIIFPPINLLFVSKDYTLLNLFWVGAGILIGAIIIYITNHTK